MRGVKVPSEQEARDEAQSALLLDEGVKAAGNRLDGSSGRRLSQRGSRCDAFCGLLYRAAPAMQAAERRLPDTHPPYGLP